MKPSPFDYSPVETADEAISELGRGDAKLIAGGQSLLPMMHMRVVRASRLVDVRRVDELDRVEVGRDNIVMGALVRHRRMEHDPQIATSVPLLPAATVYIGHPAIRNRGTLGGSLAHADPAAELPAVMVALDATLFIDGGGRPRREVKADDFCLSYFSTVCQEDEMVTWIRVPKLGSRSGWGFVEFARRHGDFAMAGAVSVLRCDASGALESAKVVAFGVGATPLTVSHAEEVLGSSPKDLDYAALGRAWARAVPDADGDGYRRHLAAIAIERALRQASERVGAVDE